MSNTAKITELENKLFSLDIKNDFWEIQFLQDELGRLRSEDCPAKLHFKKIYASGGNDYCLYCSGK